MIEAYAISVAATLEDGVTPPLLRIIDALSTANAAMLEFAANVRRLSSLGLSASRSLDKATAAATALGDSTAGLTRASYVLDTMAASSADLARNMAAARAEGGGIGRYGAGAGAIRNATGSGRDPEGGRFARNAAAGVGISLGYGLYEDARLQDTNIRAAATSQIAVPAWIQTADELRKREFEYARKYAYATHGRIAPFGEAMLESSRLLRTLSPKDQKILTDAAMPYAALEAKLKGVSLPEGMQAFIGLAHQAGAYKPSEAITLFESMLQASLTTHASLQQISRAASYALPSLHAAGANSPDVLMLLATMMQAGILNTKSGTWLNDMALNALPNTLGSGLFKNKLQNKALEELGLYKDGKSQFYKSNHLDLMKMVEIFAQARMRMGAEEFNAVTRQGLGLQGMRAASLFSEPQVVQNLSTLASLSQQAQPPLDINAALRQLSAVSQADQTIANANMTLMNASATFMAPVTSALGAASSFFGWTADYTKRHPVLGAGMDAGMAVGAAGLLGAAWKGGAIGIEALGKKIIGPAIGWLLKGIWKVAAKAIGDITSDLMIGAVAGTAELGLAASSLAVAIAGAVGYGIGTVLNHGFDLAIQHITGGKESNLGGWISDVTHRGEINKALAPTPLHSPVAISAAPQSPTVVHLHNKIELDGKTTAESVSKFMLPNHSRGSTTFNAAALPMSAGMTAGGM